MVIFQPSHIYEDLLVSVEGVFTRQLVIGTHDKTQLVNRDTNGFKHGLDDVFIVLCTQTQQVPWSLHVVEVGVKVGKEDRDLSSEEEEEEMRFSPTLKHVVISVG